MRQAPDQPSGRPFVQIVGWKARSVVVVDDLASALSQLGDHVLKRVLRVIENGFELSAGSLFERLGLSVLRLELHEGDIVQRVVGVDLDDREKATALVP